jgi:hypothetical protein
MTRECLQRSHFHAKHQLPSVWFELNIDPELGLSAGNNTTPAYGKESSKHQYRVESIEIGRVEVSVEPPSPYGNLLHRLTQHRLTKGRRNNSLLHYTGLWAITLIRSCTQASFSPALSVHRCSVFWYYITEKWCGKWWSPTLLICASRRLIFIIKALQR